MTSPLQVFSVFAFYWFSALMLFSCSPDITEQATRLLDDFENELDGINHENLNTYELVQKLRSLETELSEAVSSITVSENISLHNKQILDSLTAPSRSNAYKRLWSVVDKKNEAALRYAAEKHWISDSGLSNKWENIFSIHDNTLRFLHFKTEHELTYNSDKHCFESSNSEIFFDVRDDRLMIIDDIGNSSEFTACKSNDFIVGEFRGHSYISRRSIDVKLTWNMEVESTGYGTLSFLARTKMYGQTISEERSGQIRLLDVQNDKYSFSFDGERSHFNILFTYGGNSLSGNISDFGHVTLERLVSDHYKSLSDILYHEKEKNSSRITQPNSNYHTEENKIRRGSKGSENWDEVLDEYEAYVDQYIKFFKQAMTGDMGAMSEYPELIEKANALGEKLEKAKGDLNSEQIGRMMEIQNKMLQAAAEMQ